MSLACGCLHLVDTIVRTSGVYASGQKKSDMVKQGEQKRVQDRVVVTERDQAGSLGKLADAVRGQNTGKLVQKPE